MGDWADLETYRRVVLSDDITRIDPGAIGDVQVDYTIVGGEVVHTRDAAAARARHGPDHAGRQAAGTSTRR